MYNVHTFINAQLALSVTSSETSGGGQRETRPPTGKRECLRPKTQQDRVLIPFFRFPDVEMAPLRGLDASKRTGSVGKSGCPLVVRTGEVAFISCCEDLPFSLVALICVGEAKNTVLPNTRSGIQPGIIVALSPGWGRAWMGTWRRQAAVASGGS